MIGPAARRHLVRYRACLFANFLTIRRARLPYAEVRPMRSFFTRWCSMPKAATDCSESTSMILGASGAPTPYVVNNAGYTGTQLATLPHIPFHETRRADLAVFVNPARPNGDHVVMLLQGGRRVSDPLVWSHGRPGVDVMRLSQMKAGFPGCAVVFLKSVPDEYTKAEYRAVKERRVAGEKAAGTR